MKKFEIRGINYAGKTTVVIIEARTKTAAVNKFGKEYGGLALMAKEIN